jgi:alpha,alpha-trehalase
VSVQPDTSPERFSLQHYEAVVLDLDGVITRSQELHARAWKRAFDEFLHQRWQEAGADSRRYRPFEIDPEYLRHVDGKPRYHGVRGFLHARGIDLPEGDPDDPPGHDSIQALGNRKNELFLELLDQEGVEVYEDSLDFLCLARCMGLCTSVVSSSRNCAALLTAAGAAECFDGKVDGRDVDERHLEGKPAPDIFLAAAEDLGVTPADCIGVEDAVAGVEAARRAGYGCVIGLNRGQESQAQALARTGAHRVVRSLAELTANETGSEGAAADVSGLPVEALAQRLDRRAPAVFLDFDGTLTPIVDRPSEAVLTEEMRAVLSQVSRSYPTAVISGRDLADVRERVGIEDLVYAGSHGFDILLPDGNRHSPEAARDALPALAEAADTMEERLADVEGAFVERKRYAVAVHHRLAEDERRAGIEQAVDEIVARHPELRKRGGKKIFEFLPDIDWDKGEALRLLLDVMELADDPDTIPIYLGDDVTDEDAFAVLHDRGIGIAVGRAPGETAAPLTVADVDAVRRLLCWLCRRGCSAA